MELSTVGAADAATPPTGGTPEDLAAWVRQFLVSSVASTGGHIGANLGTVELTEAGQPPWDPSWANWAPPPPN